MPYECRFKFASVQTICTRQAVSQLTEGGELFSVS